MYGHGGQQIAVGAGSEQDAPNRRPLHQPAGNSNTRQTIIGDQQRSIHSLGLISFTDRWGNWPAIQCALEYVESVMSSHRYTSRVLLSCSSLKLGWDVSWEFLGIFLGGGSGMGVEWAGLGRAAALAIIRVIRAIRVQW